MRKVVATGLGVFALVAAVAAVAAPVGGETRLDTFEAVAAAEGFRVSVAAPRLSVVNTLVDVGGPAAQARVDGLGTSTGYAAYPDPGELVLTGPGLLAGASGGALSFPAFPTAVQTTFPAAPDGRVGEGPFLVEAHSTAVESTALARSGSADLASGRAEATSRAALEGDVVVATSTARGDALTIGPLLIGSFVAEASARAVPGQEPELTSDFRASGIAVNGTPVGLTPAGLVVAGTDVPLPATDPARAALADAGIDVHYLSAVSGDAAASSAGVQVTVRQVLTDGVPGAIPAGQVIEYRIVLGRAVAAAGSTAALPAVVDELPGEIGTALPAPPAGPAGGPVALGSTPPTDQAGAAASASPGPVADVAARPAVQRSVTPEQFSFYWVLVVAAAAAAIALHLNRTAGPRRDWLAVRDQPVAPAEGGLP